MQHQRLVVLSGVLLLIITLLASYAVKKPHNIREAFTDNVKPSFLNAMYESKGIESCDVISGSNYMSTNYIDPLRIRKWKPTESDPKYEEWLATSSNQAYCYFLMDDDKRMLKTEDFPDGYASAVDPLANFQNCSKANSLFKDTPIIRDAFESTGYDATHNLPYKKCILQIDKAEASSPEAVDAFWRGFGGANNNAFCEGIANTLKAEANAYLNKIRELANDLNPFRQTYQSVNNARSSLSNCYVQNSNLNVNITASNEKLASLQRMIGSSNDKLGMSIYELQSQLEPLREAINVKTSDLTSLNNNYNVVLIPDIKQANENIKSTTAQRDKCRAELALVTRQLAFAKTTYDNLNISYRQLTIDHSNCEKVTREYIGNIEDQTPILLDIEQKLAITKEQLQKCKTEQARLVQEEQFWNDRLQKTRFDFDKCSDARAKLEAHIASLKDKKDALIKEIEEIKRRCRDDQSSFNMATVNIHRESAKEIISTEQQRCAASIAMRKRRVELMNEINGLLAQANSCDRTIATCKCFKRVATFAWNNHGISDSRFNTTTGRINNVRKHLGGAPFIRFEGGGPPSDIRRVTKTKKKAGGGSYIEVSGNTYSGAARTAVMYQQM